MNARDIYLTRKLRLILPASDGLISAAAAAFSRNLECLGFVASPSLLKSLSAIPHQGLAELYADIVPVLQQMTGAHRTYKPMYPNFPKQVMEASDLELYCNAVLHYWGSYLSDRGISVRYLPEYHKESRDKLPTEDIYLRVIDLGDSEDFRAIFSQLMAANTAWSESDRAVVSWFVENNIKWDLPSPMPQKENLAYFLAAAHKENVSVCPSRLGLKTATDVLRVAVAMSGGDVSLAKPGKFRRFARRERRFLLEMLESTTNPVEDMARRPEVWKRLGRELRSGDYCNKYPIANAAFHVICSGSPVKTFASQVEASLVGKDFAQATAILATRPGELTRRLDHLLRSGDSSDVLSQFQSVASQVATPVLLQAYAHFKHRDNPAPVRTIFPKGAVAKVQVLEESLPPLRAGVALRAAAIIRQTLVARFASLPALGAVYIDKALKTQLVPFATRSASKTLRTLARGSHLPIPDSNCLRFFVWWKDGKDRTDIDLSAIFYGDDWKRLGFVSYYQLRDYGCCHSGDITSAPNGAAEFIDIDCDTLRSKGVRYVQQVITAYTQQPFCDLPECFAGWMSRSKPKSGEIFEARTVRDRIDIASDTKVCVPLTMDIVARKAIWMDVALKSTGPINNVHASGDRLAQIGKAMSDIRKPTLYDLFEMHAEARGQLTSRRKNAAVVFSMDEGITPFDAGRIVSEFMAS